MQYALGKGGDQHVEVKAQHTDDHQEQQGLGQHPVIGDVNEAIPDFTPDAGARFLRPDIRRRLDAGQTEQHCQKAEAVEQKAPART
ncbi:hypothetical protein D3C81_1836630 [compost metagenome]